MNRKLKMNSTYLYTFVIVIDGWIDMCIFNCAHSFPLFLRLLTVVSEPLDKSQGKVNQRLIETLII